MLWWSFTYIDEQVQPRETRWNVEQSASCFSGLLGIVVSQVLPSPTLYMRHIDFCSFSFLFSCDSRITCCFSQELLEYCKGGVSWSACIALRCGNFLDQVFEKTWYYYLLQPRKLARGIELSGSSGSEGITGSSSDFSFRTNSTFNWSWNELFRNWVNMDASCFRFDKNETDFLISCQHRSVRAHWVVCARARVLSSHSEEVIARYNSVDRVVWLGLGQDVCTWRNSHKVKQYQLW